MCVCVCVCVYMSISVHVFVGANKYSRGIRFGKAIALEGAIEQGPWP